MQDSDSKHLSTSARHVLYPVTEVPEESSQPGIKEKANNVERSGVVEGT